jgi:hypothetical protein
MIEQASLSELKPESPSEEIMRQLENLHKNKVKPNFGFQNVDCPLVR